MIAHEKPYLHQGNTQTRIEEGMVMTLEPGVYRPEFGVRTEDVVVVREGTDGDGDGDGERWVDVLSGERARGSWDP